MSTELLKEVQEKTKRTNGTLKLQKCELNLQAYGPTTETCGPNSSNSGTYGLHPSSIRVNTQHVSTPHWERST